MEYIIVKFEDDCLPCPYLTEDIDYLWVCAHKCAFNGQEISNGKKIKCPMVSKLEGINDDKCWKVRDFARDVWGNIIQIELKPKRELPQNMYYAFVSYQSNYLMKHDVRLLPLGSHYTARDYIKFGGDVWQVKKVVSLDVYRLKSPDGMIINVVKNEIDGPATAQEVKDAYYHKNPA